MAERIVTPRSYIVGDVNNATLTVRYRDINGKRRTHRIKGINSYRLSTDGSLFSVRKANKAGVRNALTVTYGVQGTRVKIGQGHPLVTSGLTLELSEGKTARVVA